ncbi:MAG TPA: CocE/NonD family hydrolase [Allosphingosinicella sp.]|nr:CocE/NonD family hydrolase [Allosphingosinicella sp.]
MAFGAAWSATTANAASPTIVRVPVHSRVSGADFSLEAFVYRPATKGKHPLVLLSHGSSGGNPKMELPQQELAGFFTNRGFVVIAAMRRGRGKSGGVSLESEEKDCDPGSWKQGLAAAFEDVTAALDFAGKMPDVDAGTVLLVGESRGGFLSVAYAAEGARRIRVRGVVNFVGGWVAQAEDRCPTDFNQISFGRYGAETRLPELWLYGDHDPFYAASSIRDYQRAFISRGGKLSFALISGVPGNGHWLPGYPGLWSGKVESYLASRWLATPAGGHLGKAN